MHATRDTSTGSRGHTPARTCIVSRAERDPSELIRFVIAPAGTVVPDLACKLPGRGAWVSGYRAVVEQAARKGAFHRAFRQQVTVPENLADVVDELLARRTLQALSLANKAGAVVCGFGKVDARIAAGGAAALINACDASDGGTGRLARKYRAVCRETETDPVIIEILTIAQLGLAMGRLNVVHAALSPGKATDAFISATRRLCRYRQTDAPGTDCSSEVAGTPYAGEPASEHDAGPETEEV